RYVHPVYARNERQRQQDDRDDGEHFDDLVDAVGCERVDGVAQPLNDFLIIFERVPYLAQVVCDVPEILLHVLAEEGTVLALQAGDDGDERLNDAAERYDISPDDGDLLDGTANLLLEYLVLDLLDVGVYL